MPAPSPFITSIAFNQDGLIPVIAQDATSHAVLMLAWMNEEALHLTLRTGNVTYWSRARQQLWRKGETSGHTQTLVEAHLDCDSDALLLRVNQTGAACHTGATNCFFKKIDLIPTALNSDL